MLTAENIWTHFEQKQAALMREIDYFGERSLEERTLPEVMFSALNTIWTLAAERRPLTIDDHSEYWSGDGYERSMCADVLPGLETFGRRPLSLEDRAALNHMILCVKYLLQESRNGIATWYEFVPRPKKSDAMLELEQAVAAALREYERRSNP
jgi:hypothetical protein